MHYLLCIFQAAKLAELGLKATFFDKIAAMSHHAFNTLAATIPESMSGRKVLAAMIMKTSPTDEGSVISLGTGREFSVFNSTVK